MFELLETAPPDPILGLTEAFQRDPRSDKINLSVGVYQDADGATPILVCVKEAEKRLLAGEKNKGYLRIDGSAEFASQVGPLVLGEGHPALSEQRNAVVQAPGGTGALRVAADFLKRKFPAAAVWCSLPTWPNHLGIMASAGLRTERYPYLDAAGTGLDFAALTAGLERVSAGDVVLLHACCHNPTGVDPTPEQWRRIGELLASRGALPLVDFAYQGFGDGLAEDARALAELSRSCPELLVCSSFSKNFGLYGERVGALLLVASSAAAAGAALSHVKAAVRTNYSNPPKHGGAVVAAVLADAGLRRLWEDEVSQMRSRIQGMRRLFVDTLAAKGVARDFSFLLRQRGMFSYSGLTPVQVDELRHRHGVYIVGDGRINVAGMTEGNMHRLCDAVAAVL